VSGRGKKHAGQQAGTAADNPLRHNRLAAVPERVNGLASVFCESGVYPSGVPTSITALPYDVQPAIGFVLRLGRALHTYGYSAQALEDVLGLASERLGIPGHQFFSTPTSIMASFGDLHDQQRVYMLRVKPGDVDLGKLADLDCVTGEVLRGEITPAAGSERIEKIVEARPIYGDAVTTAAFGLASAASTRFLGGGLREIVVAGGIGIVIGLLALLAQRRPALHRVFEPVAALVGASLATALAVGMGPFSVYTAMIGGLIVLIPGLTLTVAMTELATQHLASGTARLSGALMIFLSIAFGVALGSRLTAELLGAVRVSEATQLPLWTLLVAMVVASLSFTVILRAKLQDAAWILAAGALAVGGGRWGGTALGPDLGVFVGAFTVGVASNLLARYRDRPAAITQVPGVLLLVPGSIGFRSLASLLDHQIMVGVETAFRMVLTAASLVAGLLIANIVSPVRRQG
jgi:uncharacterized membrane protein YjjP (DUF1212 family)